MPAACEISPPAYELTFVSAPRSRGGSAWPRPGLRASSRSKTAKPRPRAGAAAEAIFHRALERGLSFKVTMGNVLTLTPPLVISEDDLMRRLDILEACIGEVGVAAGVPKRVE